MDRAHATQSCFALNRYYSIIIQDPQLHIFHAETRPQKSLSVHFDVAVLYEIGYVVYDLGCQRTAGHLKRQLSQVLGLGYLPNPLKNLPLHPGFDLTSSLPHPSAAKLQSWTYATTINADHRALDDLLLSRQQRAVLPPSAVPPRVHPTPPPRRCLLSLSSPPTRSLTPRT